MIAATIHHLGEHTRSVWARLVPFVPALFLACVGRPYGEEASAAAEATPSPPITLADRVVLSGTAHDESRDHFLELVHDLGVRYDGEVEALPPLVLWTPFTPIEAQVAASVAVAQARSVRIGWVTTDGLDEAAQARWSVRGLLVAWLAGVDTVYLPALYDGAGSASGLVRVDGSPKPAFGAVKTLLRAVGASTRLERISPDAAPGDVYAVALTQASGKRAWAAWRSDDGQDPWTWTLGADVKGTVYTLDGRERGAAGATLDVTRDPVYVVE
jgi:hypothetical protein